jgi:hypothetical protein
LVRGEVHQSDCSTIPGLGSGGRGLKGVRSNFPRDQENLFCCHYGSHSIMEEKEVGKGM